MPRLSYYVAATVDGFIADPQDSLDWLMRHEMDPGGANDIDTFLAGVGAIVMGSTTYEWLLAHGAWDYQVPVWVMTTRALPLPASTTAGGSADVRFSRAALPELVAEMRAAAGQRELWVMGGGDLAGQFADAGLLDEILLTVAPVVLGAGRPLLPRRLDLELLETARNGAFVTARYRVLGPLTEDRTPA
ncbi:Dihydrofolate reductase [Leucobacter sp. 7(1)]|uniref:dihydrofolate reductase family protein n=1 Tax=Leucobacter sp. 7(1) TaxID=1255613 RepID=UPI00097EA2AF|nr:dihydrofolate reductase family protein [Leucobacter sp. 7(1)]SJN12269.1 Dihydrofolate reductase [Leucobacter sp. 7(1)]